MAEIILEKKPELARLRIYIGAAPGVGKTYHMLNDAHVARKQGVDLIIGLIEPHSRQETFDQIKDLEIVPLREIPYRGVTLITGGFPCQPFSSAGQRRGAEDDRHLWPAMLRIIEKARPRWVLSENVVGHITLGLDQVLADMDAIGYSARATVIPACAVDARHRRDRVWIVAGDADRLNVNTVGSLSDNLADTGGTGWRCAAPGMDRKADGLPGAVDRNYGLGNAIVPQVAAEILRAMMRVNQMSNNAICKSHEI